MEWKVEEIDELFKKYNEKKMTITKHINESTFIRHEIYSENKDWFNYPDKKEEVDNRCRHGDDLEDKKAFLYKLLENVYDALDELDRGIDECEADPYNENVIY
jgi:hypothetical protein